LPRFSVPLAQEGWFLSYPVFRLSVSTFSDCRALLAGQQLIS
jgi:hypothetical protein